MAERIRFTNHERYIASVPEDVRSILLKIQAVVESAVPGASRCVSYNMPAYRHSRTFFYFAAFKNHIGVYPPVKEDAQLILQLQRYRGDKGNLRFNLREPMPYDLIGKVAIALAEESFRM